jgi:hypothetical protein
MTALSSVRLLFNKDRNQNLTTDNTDQTDFHRSREAGTKERECAGRIGENRDEDECDRARQD